MWLTDMRISMKMKKPVVNVVVLNLDVTRREANCIDKPANAGSVEKVVNFLYVYGPSIVKIIRLGMHFYSMHGN